MSLESDRDARVVTVCKSCRRASCWHGSAFCEDARSAGIIDVSVGVLYDEMNEAPLHFDSRLAGYPYEEFFYD